MAAIAFDFDGTLLDSRRRHIVVMQDILNSAGIKLNADDLIEYKSSGKNNIDYLVFHGVDVDTAKRIQEQWIANIEQDNYLALDVLYDDAIDLLNKYSVDNDLILLTARANVGALNRQIDKFGLRKYFKNVFIVHPGKTAANDKADILRSNNAILMIGDTRSDFMAAQLAGVKFIFRDVGFHNKQTTMGEQ